MASTEFLIENFTRFQLANTIYPSYDPIYKEISKSKTGYVGSMKKKRTYASGPRHGCQMAIARF